MQIRLKEEISADLNKSYGGITDFKTKQNQYEINCGVCNKLFYADYETFEGIDRAI